MKNPFRSLTRNGASTLPLVVGAALSLCVFIILIFQAGAGNNEVVFKQESDVINSWLLEYGEKSMAARIAGEPFEHDEHYVSHILQRIEAAAKKLKGPEAEITRARAVILTKFHENHIAYVNSLGSFQRSGGFDIKTISNRQGIIERIRLLDQVLAANARHNDTQQNLGVAFREEMSHRGVPEWMIARELENTRMPVKDKNIEYRRRLAYVEQQQFETAQRIFKLLDEQWGQWTFGHATSSIIIDSPDAAKSYEELIELSQKISDSQTELYKEFWLYYY